MNTLDCCQEPSCYSGGEGFRKAFLRSVEECNQFGVAASNAKYQVSHDAALQLYGFKVSELGSNLSCWLGIWFDKTCPTVLSSIYLGPRLECVKLFGTRSNCIFTNFGGNSQVGGISKTYTLKTGR